MAIGFFKEGVAFRVSHKEKLRKVIVLIGLVEQKQLGDINVVLVSDHRLLEINRQFLEHDYYTDIITFQYPTPNSVVSGDLYISIDRVTDNARSLKLPVADELARVVIHGVLHLCGYRDKQPVDKKLMRKKEDFYLESMKTL
jgi:probable rRNA maturation factor